MKRLKASLMLALAAFIWGNAFVAQSVGMDHVGPWTFNCLRSLIGGVTLLVLMPFLDRVRGGKENHSDQKILWQGGILTGIVLCAASMFQQTGIQYTTVGKAGFLTALYTVIVPVLGILRGKKTRPLIWICVGISVCGMYLLTMKEGFSISKGDLLILICAFLFAVHILVIDYYSPKTDGVRLSCIQFFTAGILSLIPMLVFEHPQWSDIVSAAAPILYAGVLSSGAGYTLQIIGQKDADPAVASMLLSLESVFAALAGFVFLHQKMSAREMLGCLLIFAAILLAQMPDSHKEVS